MPEIQVSPAAVSHASAHVSGIAGHINSMQGRMGHHVKRRELVTSEQKIGARSRRS